MDRLKDRNIYSGVKFRKDFIQLYSVPIRAIFGQSNLIRLILRFLWIGLETCFQLFKIFLDCLGIARIGVKRNPI